jgi:hypothetical protein
MPANLSREFEVKRVFRFERDLKHILKTYLNFNQNIQTLSESLKKNLEQSELLGEGVYKVRVDLAAEKKKEKG